jgi:hypothetical protein
VPGSGGEAIFRRCFVLPGGVSGVLGKCNPAYNPAYNLRAMTPRWKSIECPSRGNMSTTHEEKAKNETEPGGARDSASSESLFGRCYEICIGSRLDSSWSDWFEGLDMFPSGENWTILCGRVADQAALLGILNKLCRLNLPLVSVNEVKGTKRPSDPGPEGGE